MNLPITSSRRPRIELERASGEQGTMDTEVLDQRPINDDELHRHLVAKLIGIPSTISVIRQTEKLDLAITPEELALNHDRN